MENNLSTNFHYLCGGFVWKNKFPMKLLRVNPFFYVKLIINATSFPMEDFKHKHCLIPQKNQNKKCVFVWMKIFSMCVHVCVKLEVCWYTNIHLICNFMLMETFTSNLVNSSFEHLLHSYDLHLVSRYKWSGQFFFNFISYLLHNIIPSTEAKQYGISKSMFVIKYKETPTMSHSRITSNFFVWFASRYC
jgi:hypothetical protein